MTLLLIGLAGFAALCWQVARLAATMIAAAYWTVDDIDEA